MSDFIAHIESLFLGQVQTVADTNTGEWWDKSWTTSFFKTPQMIPAGSVTKVSAKMNKPTAVTMVVLIKRCVFIRSFIIPIGAKLSVFPTFRTALLGKT